MKEISKGICAPKGYKAAGIHCGIRKNQTKKDLALIVSETRAAAAAVYTCNLVKSAPIKVTKKNLTDGYAQAVVCNSGIANTCRAEGVEMAERMCALVERTVGIPAGDVIVASTGVIGAPLPIDRIESGMPALVAALGDHSGDAESAIMTTDTVPKEYAVEFEVEGVPCRLGGIAKGSGMIHPNMATMLCFLTTDASIEPELLQMALSAVTRDTFNMVSVDGDTSTNDMALIMASGQAGNPTICNPASPDYQAFVNGLYAVMMNLSREIARDGEGATKLLECVVSGAVNEDSAKIVAKSVITSSLFKSAMFGEDANWGRILCAVGYAQTDLDPEQVEVTLKSENGKVLVCRKGRGVPFSEELAKDVLRAGEIQILIRLGDGDGKAVAWGCDLTYDYVKINGSYRT